MHTDNVLQNIRKFSEPITVRRYEVDGCIPCLKARELAFVILKSAGSNGIDAIYESKAEI